MRRLKVSINYFVVVDHLEKGLVHDVVTFSNDYCTDAFIFNAEWQFRYFFKCQNIKIESATIEFSLADDCSVYGNRWRCTQGVKFLADLHCSKSLNVMLNMYNLNRVKKQML